MTEGSFEMDQLFRLIAIEDIKALKARYFRANDTKDRALLRSCFTSDISLDARGATTDPITGVNAAPDLTDKVYKGVDTVLDVVFAGLQGTTTVHQACLPEIEILSESDATGVWALFDALLFSKGSVSELTGYGHYHDIYERVDGKWKIKAVKISRLRLDIKERSP
jgi:hypothetical protein